MPLGYLALAWSLVCFDRSMGEIKYIYEGASPVMLWMLLLDRSDNSRVLRFHEENCAMRRD